MLGGSAVHFALAASFFTEVRVVGPVGDDFGPDEHRGPRATAGSTPSDIERVAGGETFFWRGHYEHDMNVAHTDDTQLNVFADFEPKLSPRLARRRDALPRQHPARPAAAGPRPVARPGFAALDSMNLWIDTARESLVAAIGEVDCLLLNDAELRMLTGEPNLARAARAAMEMGPSVGRRQARRVRRGAVHRRRLLRDSRACRSRTSATRPAPATASPAASSATSTGPRRRRATTTGRCARRWPTAR